MGENLRERVKAQNGQQTVGTDVAKSEPTLRDSIISMEKEFAAAMPRGAEAVQLIRDAITAVRTVRNLDKCDTQSVLGGLMTCAQLGLRVGVLGQAFVMPFWSSKAGGYRAQFVAGYPGLVELAYRSPAVSSVAGRKVCENDLFDMDWGGAHGITHKPPLRGRRGPAYGYYAIVHFTNGGSNWFYMSKEDAEDYRDEHATQRDKTGKIFGPWIDDFDPMAEKSCFRQLAKWVPKGSELAVALAADQGVRVDLSTGPAESTESLMVVNSEVVTRPTSGSAQSATEQGEWPATAPIPNGGAS